MGLTLFIRVEYRLSHRKYNILTAGMFSDVLSKGCTYILARVYLFSQKRAKFKTIGLSLIHFFLKREKVQNTKDNQ